MTTNTNTPTTSTPEHQHQHLESVERREHKAPVNAISCATASVFHHLPPPRGACYTTPAPLTSSPCHAPRGATVSHVRVHPPPLQTDLPHSPGISCRRGSPRARSRLGRRPATPKERRRPRHHGWRLRPLSSAPVSSMPLCKTARRAVVFRDQGGAQSRGAGRVPTVECQSSK
jgi:hypothetical protein